MKRFLNLIKNKFLLAVIAFVIWMCFFDRYDFAAQYNYYQEKAKLEKEKEFYVSEIAYIEKSIKDVQFNPSEIQRIAREKYKMKKDNEDVYVLTEVVAEN
ncbi:septum formation initiator family protein [Sphingobacterium pedocola]|uniref:Septum formation initiator n=1 Tax=Sphingobacterium pedocola TaxID=2082722 RepID=A0ABR9T6R5_9SPHI|nr:septum formation initiator family protein [Sphingobacterium pedocola]MBE8720702.1 septum formation initiator [Sphingobacterium pedocola]